LDVCLAVRRALDRLVRIPSASDENILMALDAGAVGLWCRMWTVCKGESDCKSRDISDAADAASLV
jgi:hypothetical protein